MVTAFPPYLQHLPCLRAFILYVKGETVTERHTCWYMLVVTADAALACPSCHSILAREYQVTRPSLVSVFKLVSPTPVT